MTEAIPGRTSFDLENPFLADWLDAQSLELAGNVSATTITFLQATLSDGIRAGESVPQLEARVRDIFREASATRANLIARTEANKAANGASWTQATNSGVVKTKTWLATGDARTRPEHRILNGETVPIDKPFSNGLMFPSEPRCRCTLTYGVDTAGLTRAGEAIAKEARAQARYEARLIREMEAAETSRLSSVIQEQGGIRSVATAGLQEEYRNIPNTFKRKDGLPGDLMAEYFATHYPEFGIETEADLLDFFADRYGPGA